MRSDFSNYFKYGVFLSKKVSGFMYVGNWAPGSLTTKAIAFSKKVNCITGVRSTLPPLNTEVRHEVGDHQ